MAGVKTLLLMRHAKSDWAADYSRDHERPLNRRGIESAKAMGRVLTDRGLAPDLVISSTAVRARTTAELASQAGDWRGSTTLDETLYSASSQEVIGVAAAAPAVDRLMLVGHQPTWSSVVYELTGEYVDMKTAAVAVIEPRIDQWIELSPGLSRLLDVLYPRDFLD